MFKWTLKNAIFHACHVAIGDCCVGKEKKKKKSLFSAEPNKSKECIVGTAGIHISSDLL